MASQAREGRSQKATHHGALNITETIFYSKVWCVGFLRLIHGLYLRVILENSQAPSPKNNQAKLVREWIFGCNLKGVLRDVPCALGRARLDQIYLMKYEPSSIGDRTHLYPFALV